MMEEKEKNDNDSYKREEIYSNVVKAGKRTYFFDVKVTRGGDYYLTLTESKKRYNDDGTFRYHKHKIFLYKEDFEKFSEALAETIKKVIGLRMEQNEKQMEEIGNRIADKFTDVSFEDLGDSNGTPSDAADEQSDAVEEDVSKDRKDLE